MKFGRITAILIALIVVSVGPVSAHMMSLQNPSGDILSENKINEPNLEDQVNLMHNTQQKNIENNVVSFKTEKVENKAVKPIKDESKAVKKNTITKTIEPANKAPANTINGKITDDVTETSTETHELAKQPIETSNDQTTSSKVNIDETNNDMPITDKSKDFEDGKTNVPSDKVENVKNDTNTDITGDTPSNVTVDNKTEENPKEKSDNSTNDNTKSYEDGGIAIGATTGLAVGAVVVATEVAAAATAATAAVDATVAAVEAATLAAEGEVCVVSGAAGLEATAATIAAVSTVATVVAVVAVVVAVAVAVYFVGSWFDWW